MLIWFLLFVVILIVSFILAYYSMTDYQENPSKSKSPYSLYLIQKVDNLSSETIDELHRKALSEKLLVSFETLFKGDKRATVIYGPVSLINPLTEKLGLVELEDYTQKPVFEEMVSSGSILAWEVGLRTSVQGPANLQDFKLNVPELLETEQFWWQLVLQPIGKGFWDNFHQMISIRQEAPKTIESPTSAVFQAFLRAVIIASDPKRAENLQSELSKIGNDAGLARLPQPYTSPQILKFYQQRVFSQVSMKYNKKGSNIVLTAEEVQYLIGAIKFEEN